MVESPSPSATAVELADGSGVSSEELRRKETERIETKEDIEHLYVEDDPRLWSHKRKTVRITILDTLCGSSADSDSS